MKRRDFVKTTALAVSALPLYSATFKNKPYQIALIGTGWWGMNILREAIAFGNCKVVGLCDVDRKALELSRDEVKKLNGDSPKLYNDFRELLSKQKPDITIVATPDHWHALPAVEAIKNGSHVYLEKPIAHTVKEGTAILNAARKYNKKVQVGTHRRLSEHNISAMEFLRSGKAGKISEVKTFVNYKEGPGKIVPDTEPPEHLDWDMWLGPAPYRNFNPDIHPKGFRNYLDYTNGQISNWGIHWFDQVLWWSGEKYPKNVFSTGGRYIKQDGTDAPDTQLAVYEFENFTMSWEHKLCAQNFNEASQFGCYFYGTEGTFHLGWRDGWTFYPKDEKKSIIKAQAKLATSDYHNVKESWSDFVLAIENNTLPTSDIESGHLATTMSQLAMISLKQGRSLKWDGVNETILNDSDSQKLLFKNYRGPWEFPKV